MEELREMVNALGPSDKIHWDLALYWIFIINIVVMMMQPEGSAFTTLLGILVLVSAVIDKTYGFGYMFDPGPYSPKQCHEEVFIGTYLIRVAMFVAPLAIAGSTTNPKSRGVAVLAGISGGVYMFTRWYFDQRDITTTAITCSYIGFFMLAARVLWHERLFPVTVHRHIPVTVAGDLATHDIEV